MSANPYPPFTPWFRVENFIPYRIKRWIRVRIWREDPRNGVPHVDLRVAYHPDGPQAGEAAAFAAATAASVAEEELRLKLIDDETAHAAEVRAKRLYAEAERLTAELLRKREAALQVRVEAWKRGEPTRKHQAEVIQRRLDALIKEAEALKR